MLTELQKFKGGKAPDCSELDANEAIADAEEFLKLAEKRTR